MMDPNSSLAPAEFDNVLHDEICGGFDEHCIGHYVRHGGTRVQSGLERAIEHACEHAIQKWSVLIRRVPTKGADWVIIKIASDRGD
jgi:hypothetical protein